MRNSKVQFIVHAAMIAAIYVVLTYFISAFNLASGAIQVRISESLTILPYLHRRQFQDCLWDACLPTF